jgi:hypothetical protein
MLHALLLIDDSLAEVRTSEILPIVVETMSSLVDRQVGRVDVSGWQKQAQKS